MLFSAKNRTEDEHPTVRNLPHDKSLFKTDWVVRRQCKSVSSPVFAARDIPRAACVFIWDNRYAANLLLYFTAKWNIPSVKGTDEYAKYQTCGITARCCMM